MDGYVLGDLLRFRRGVFTHWALYVGSYRLVDGLMAHSEMNTPGGCPPSPRLSSVKRQSAVRVKDETHTRKRDHSAGDSEYLGRTYRMRGRSIPDASELHSLTGCFTGVGARHLQG